MLLKILNSILNLRGSLRGECVTVSDSADKTPIAVNGVVTVYSKVRKSSYFDNIGFWLKLAGSNPNITITVEQSAKAVATANINAADANYVVGSGVAAVCTALTNTTAVVATLSLVPMKYFRFKIVGNSGNGSDTTVDLELFEQELIV